MILVIGVSVGLADKIAKLTSTIYLDDRPRSDHRR